MKRLVIGIAASVSVILAMVSMMSPFLTSALKNNSNVNCSVDNTLFEQFRSLSTYNKELSTEKSGVHVISESGTMEYMFDDFRGYAANQFLLDGFDDIGTWQLDGDSSKLHFSPEYYGGSGALEYTISPHDKKNSDLATTDLVLTHVFDEAKDLSRWNSSGYITMWMKINSPQVVDRVYIEFEDSSGDERKYQPLDNVHTSNSNTFADDPDFPDLSYPEGDSKIEKWTDFMIAPGWNYLLWRGDTYQDQGEVDMANIEKIFLHIQVHEITNGEQKIILDDLRIQDGLQKSSNPTNGMWYPPHGRPQNGVYDIDKSKDGSDNYELRLLNVRNTQYPSNGDHARMISSASVPEDFVARVRFTLTQLGPANEKVQLPSPFPAWTPSELREVPIYQGLRDNTYFRLTYDFEPDWDPGHEWFGSYISLQYNRLGLLSVWPIERNVVQDQEPKAGNVTSTTEFSPQNNVQYEMQLLVKGQFASTAIYEVKGDDCLERKAAVSYSFDHPRHGLEKRYPLAIESTGNLRTIVHEVELLSLSNDIRANVD